jgi:hypothetical protein
VKCLAITFGLLVGLGAAAAALEVVEAERLPVPLATVQVEPSTSGRTLFLLASELIPDEGHVMVLDVRTGLSRELDVPAPVASLTARDGVLYAPSWKASTVFCIDESSLTVSQQLPFLDGGAVLHPVHVAPASPPGTLLVCCHEQDQSSLLLEVDLGSGDLVKLAPAAGLVPVYAGGLVVVQELRGLSDTLQPPDYLQVRVTRRLGVAPLRNLRNGDAMHRSQDNGFALPYPSPYGEPLLGRAQAANGQTGVLVTTGEVTGLCSPDLTRRHWSTHGCLLAVSRSRPLAVLLVLGRGRHRDRFYLRGVHTGSGREFWRVRVQRVPDELDGTLLGPSILRAPASIAHAPGGDRLIVGTSRRPRPTGKLGRFQWWSIPLPETPDLDPVPALQMDPPARVVAGTALTIPVDGTVAVGSTFRLLDGPRGVAVDPASGTIAWTPTPEQLGCWDLLVGLELGEDTVPVLHARIMVENEP